MNSEEIYTIREWSPLLVMEKIPARIQRAMGLFPADLNITCIAAIAEFLALGTDVGVVYWYNRHTDQLQKLKAEVQARITCVSIVNSVEYMVAAGNSSGQVSVFQIQKELPPDLKLVAPCTRHKPIQRYTIRDLHGTNSISCCEWSKNGMKLYSGDQGGVVVLTEFDYPSHRSKSVEILAETYEIVQLSVHRSYLLVSTLYRAIICQRVETTGAWRITQVGIKDRNYLVDCGGIFHKRDTEPPQLICGRPGLRFWIADVNGDVDKTLLFRNAVERSPTWEIPILNPKLMLTPTTPISPVSDLNGGSVKAKNFHTFHLYAGQDSLLVTHDGDTLYILNLDRLCVEAVARGFRNILDFCVFEKEIFILEGNRTLLRLAPLPEKPNKTAKIIFNPMMPPPLPQLGATSNGGFEAPVEYAPEEDAVIGADECFEQSPINSENVDAIHIASASESPRAKQNRHFEKLFQIGDSDYDQSILHHSDSSSQNGSRKQRIKRSESLTKSQGIVEIGQAAGGGGAIPKTKKPQTTIKPKKLEFTTQPTLMDASFCSSMYSQYMPDLLSPDTLQRTIAEKAKTLAEELQLPQVHLAPITDEELHKAQVRQARPLPEPKPVPKPMSMLMKKPLSTASVTPASLNKLSQIYPVKQTQVEDASVQTTPRKSNYYLNDDVPEEFAATPYSAGEPIEQREQISLEDSISLPRSNPLGNPTSPSQYISLLESTQFPEIDSFLFDFRRACDPLQPAAAPSNPPSSSRDQPPSATSNTSNEWEFLDN